MFVARVEVGLADVLAFDERRVIVARLEAVADQTLVIFEDLVARSVLFSVRTRVDAECEGEDGEQRQEQREEEDA